jgi:glycogen operon protein
MLAHGDEMGRTQQGNNNVYCQDNPISYVDWKDARRHWALTEFTQQVSKLRREHPVFRRRRFFKGRPIRGTGALSDIAWFTPSGYEMTEEDWEVGFAMSVTVFLNGQAISEPDARGHRVVDDSFLLLFNAHHENLKFTIPRASYGGAWEVVLDTSAPYVDDVPLVKAGASLLVDARTLLVLRRDH